VNGKNNIIPRARSRLKDHGTKALHHLVLCVDLDTRADGSAAPGGTTIGMSSVGQLAKKFDSNCSQAGQTIEMWDRSVQMHLVQWSCDNGQLIEGVPDTHTLERLLSASIAAVHPQRAQAVKQWLESRPSRPEVCAKEFAFSYLAGWYAQCGGYEGFCERVWADADIRAELQVRLRSAGAWSIAEILSEV